MAQKGFKGKDKKETESAAKADSTFLLVETKAELTFGSAWFCLSFRLF